jgi:hypothetical protein
MSMTNDVQKVLPAFFAEAGGVIGAEKTYHALFTHHLFAAGAPLGAVGREVGLNGRAKVDVVLFDPAARGDFARTDLARVAIEFKGGAYGNRNALRDTVRPGRPIKDLEKLAALPGKPLERWFLSIDLPSLGRALNPDGVVAVSEAAASQGVHFAYYCAGDPTFSLRAPGGPLRSLPVPAAPAGTSNARNVAPLFAPKGSVHQWLTGQEGRLVGSEDVLVSQIYHGLRRAGFGVQQVSLETYYSFATGRSRMQFRPDLSIFEPGVRGHFNLYREGKRTQSNDALKLAQLRALIEVKGSAATARVSDAATAKLFQQDLEKLVMWQERTAQAAGKLGVKTDFESVFVGADLRARPLGREPRAALEAFAKANGIQFVYLGPS